MAKFNKINTAIAKLEARLDDMEESGVDITKLASGKRNLVAEGLAIASRNMEHKRTKAVTKTAAEWSVGDMARTRRGEIGTVTAIDGHNLVLDIAGASRKFSASLAAKIS